LPLSFKIYKNDNMNIKHKSIDDTSSVRNTNSNVIYTEVIKKIIYLALPMAGFNIMTILGFIANGLMLAKLGDTALAAGSLMAVIQATLMMVCSAPIFAVSSVVARLNGENKFFEIGGVVQQGYVLAFLLSIIAIAVIVAVKPILNALGQLSDIVDLINSYFRAYIWGIPAAMFLTCAQHLSIGLKKTKIVTIVGIIGLILSVFISYCLTFGKLGLPNLGVYGLGYGQAARVWISFLILSVFYIFSNEFKKFNLYGVNHIDRLLNLKNLFKIGWPISIHAASEFFIAFIVTIFVGWMGKTQLAIQQIACQYMLLLSVPVLAISQASNILVGTSIGKKQWDNARRYSITGVALVVSIVIIVFLCLAITPESLILSPYIDVKNNVNSGLISIFKPFLMIVMISQIFESTKTICNIILRAFYDTKPPMLISIFSGWIIGLPFAYILGNKLWGMNGFAIAQSISAAFGAFLLLDRLNVFSYNVSNPDTKAKVISTKLWPKYLA
jgi:MATE family multidrug resistance protein